MIKNPAVLKNDPLTDWTFIDLGNFMSSTPYLEMPFGYYKYCKEYF